MPGGDENRAGTRTALNNGKPLTSLVGQCPNLDKVACYSKSFGGRGTTIQVGRRSPNAWGLYDMLRNVEEWCSDGEHKYTSSAKTDPEGPRASGVHRGGRSGGPARGCRSAARSDSYADGHFGIGFRVVVRCRLPYWNWTSWFSWEVQAEHGPNATLELKGETSLRKNPIKELEKQLRCAM